MDTLKYKFSLIFFSVFVLAFALQSCGEKSTAVKVEKPAPVVESPKVEKTEPTLSAVYDSYDDLAYLFNYQNDTTYVINFWATWCAPCIAELPYFENMNKTYKDEKVKVVLISLDSKKAIDSKLRPFIQREKLMSHVVALTDTDYNTWIDKVNPDWDGAIPVTIIYNKEEYEIIKGEFDNYEELNTIVKSYLKS
jgi:thiol-disulfide isomerase/thioredoxin